MKKLTTSIIGALSLSLFLSVGVPALSNVVEADESVNSVNSILLSEEESEKIASELIENSDLEINDEALENDFDLEGAVADIPSINEMTTEEKELFDSIVNEQLQIMGVDDTELEEVYKDNLEGFFDENSETYQDIQASQAKIDEDLSDLEETHLSVLDKTANFITGDKKVQAFRLMSTRWAGTIINTALSLAVGGGVGAIASYIRSKGKKEAARLFSRTVKSRLIAWGAPKLAYTAGVAVTVALNYSDIGGMIAKQIDKRDKKKNNGYIDI
ncbi:hypothetical protein [Brochothrix thermosphacta]|uniref:Uncharacterized protein n=1 Tax=Brochothrix thermosphacta TaxID=2756 RepID=A0A1D2KZH7_BROTH|nr:hypothetical protein [Brochothrix thermosphacta]ATF27092.1 hypothetical protein CNY62_12360 [Brochothrix thermosphacta]ATH86451.1 hypothetical protein CPF12_12050 [Brochothrix thermosphacta]MPQ28029.1 hypothetical protein [Brochothrix thermosphacta]ODJ63017.1 hypothetical protein BFR36_11855 [Brochothrix thermosphacta]ODJ74216.1 hypothetical protein BFR39_09305 [Brochothrix thermosphacta]